MLNPESLYLLLGSFEVRKMLADDFIYFTERLLVSGCVTHHQICDQDVERGVLIFFVFLFLLLSAIVIVWKVIYRSCN